MNRRPRLGLTMVELLISLALLSLVTAAGVGWLQTTAARGVVKADDVRWQAAAEQAIQRIAESIAVRDFDPDDRQPQVRVTESSLRVESREPGTGQVSQMFAVEPWAHQLTRTTGQREPRLLVGDVAGWDIEIVAAEDDPDRTWLDIAIRRKSEPGVVMRRLRLP